MAHVDEVVHGDVVAHVEEVGHGDVVAHIDEVSSWRCGDSCTVDEDVDG